LIIITITYAIVSNELEIQLLEEKSDYN